MIYKFNDFINEKEEPLKTKKGSVIKRYKDVGKKMGNDLYFHKNYVDEYVDEKLYNKLKSHLPDSIEFNIIKYNDKDKTISFINSPDFDSADEPIVSDAYKVTESGKVTKTKEKSNPQIYHHKWMFVKDDYNGFNVSKSKNRSRRWLEVSDKINMSKIGSKGYWEEEVLPLLERKWKFPTEQEITSKDTSRPQRPKPVLPMIRRGYFKPDTVNLDIGGGAYDIMTDFLAEHGITNYVYDPYNRSEKHNDMVIKLTENGQADTVTIFNVMNVIEHRRDQIKTLENAKNAVKPGGKVFIYVGHPGKGDKKPGPTRDGYQHYYTHYDERLQDVVKEVFPDLEIVRGIYCLVATK